MFMAVFAFILKSIVYYIHIITRTPFIVAHLMISAYGLFADPSFGSRLCFYIFIVSVLLNVFLVVIFNNRFTKQKAIEMVGYDYYCKYLSHSAAGAKSLARLMGFNGYMIALEGATGILKDQSHNNSKESLRQDVKEWDAAGNREMAERTQKVINEMEKNYVYGGVVSQTLKAVQKTETTQKVAGTAGSTLKNIFGKGDKGDE